jgi:hypothetical protein
MSKSEQARQPWWLRACSVSSHCPHPSNREGGKIHLPPSYYQSTSRSSVSQLESKILMDTLPAPLCILKQRALLFAP